MQLDGDRPSTQGTVPRPRLQAMLDQADDRRLLAVVADAGFGKSTLLTSWAADRPCAWYTVRSADRSLAAMISGLADALRPRAPDLSAVLAAEVHGLRGPDAESELDSRALAYASWLAALLEQHLTDDVTLVLDDLHELTVDAPATRLIEGLVRIASPSLQIVVSSRTPLPFEIDRLRGRGQVLEIGAPALAFTATETLAVLRAVLGEGADELAGPLHTAVQGWPAAARLAVEALRTVPPAERSSRLQRALQADGPLYDRLAEQVLAAEPAAVRRLVAAVAGLPRFGRELCEAIGLADSEDQVQQLHRRGLLIPVGDADGYQLNPLVRDFAKARLPVDQTEMAELTRRAGKWFESVGEDRDALACYLAADEVEAARMLAERGHAMVSGGLAEPVVAAVTALPPALRTAATDQLEGEARQVLGDWQGAERCFDRIADAEGDLPVATAWRLGLIHQLRGRTDAAIATYRRGRIDGVNPTDEALLRAWWASAHWSRGELEESRGLAAAAHTVALTSGDDRALAVAHTVLAMLAAVDGEARGHATHHLRALHHAERAGDLLQAIRVRVNRGSHHIAEGDYALGLAELDVALDLADRAGFAVFRAQAHHSRGEALRRLGRLDEARCELEASRALYQRLEAKAVAQPLTVLGEVHRERGDRATARSCFAEAVAAAADDPDLLVPSLAGLARILAPEEPERATELAAVARRAIADRPEPSLPMALVALGWVTLETGDKAGAAGSAQEAVVSCRRRRDRAGLADALELVAAASGGDVLHEVLKLRIELGDPLGQARARLILAQRAAGRKGRDLALRAYEQFRVAGATRSAATALAVSKRASPPAVQIECLGGFRVLRAGRPVPLREWPAKGARELLKLLVTRHGRPVAQPRLLDDLWPGVEESVAVPRLWEALAAVRSVLDPHGEFAVDRFVGADRTTIWLDGHTAVDVENFLRDARAGLAGPDLSLLRTAEAAYSGDFLAEDVDADWAGGLREEVRAVYVRVARVLADRASAEPEPDLGAAAGYLLRILQRDQYDEQAYLGLISVFLASGAPGEARRAYRTYVQRMAELGIEPVPFPATRRTAALEL